MTIITSDWNEMSKIVVFYWKIAFWRMVPRKLLFESKRLLKISENRIVCQALRTSVVWHLTEYRVKEIKKFVHIFFYELGRIQWQLFHQQNVAFCTTFMLGMSAKRIRESVTKWISVLTHYDVSEKSSILQTQFLKHCLERNFLYDRSYCHSRD